MALIEIDKNFQYSVNLKYDFSDSAKIGKYIFTPNSIEILRKLFNSVEGDTTDKTHFLIGAYGKGKSHLILILLNLLSLNDSEQIKFARSKIAKIDDDFEKKISHSYSVGKKVLKVVVESDNSISLQNLFLKSLMQSLENENLSQFVPDNFFSAVLNTIESWKNDFPETFEKFSKKISESNENLETFISKIKEFNEDSYKIFTKIYPLLTSGSKFNPEIKGDIVEIFNSVAKKLSVIGYKGIYVVFDEFSKYLEANIEKNFDTKFLQDFAENCSKTKNDRQIHLLLITHQSFYNYLPKSLVNTWKTVAGRFDELHLDSDLAQTFEVIASVIKHNESEFEIFKKNHKAEFEKTFNLWDFPKLQQTKTSIFEKTFPLHPSSLFALPLLSEKVAQNERTIFTFLASDTQKFTLSDFLKKNESLFLTPDFLFDYFSPIFAQFPFDSEIFKTNVKCSTALSKFEGENFTLHRKILKTIAILLLIDKIPCNLTSIINIFGDESKEIVKEFLKNGILIHFEFSDLIKFPEYNSLDINKLVLEKVSKLEKNSSIEKILTEYSKTTAVYPIGYNDDNSVTRFLRIRFVSEQKSTNIIEETESFSDGTIFCVLNKTEKVEFFDENKLSVFVFLKNSEDSNKISEFALKYEASRQIYLELISKNDIETAQVIKSVCDDYGKFLEKLLSSFISFNEKNVIFLNETQISAKDKIDFDEQISKWFKNHFSSFPIILNEFVNRNKISGQTEKSVKNILNELFSSKKLLENFGFSKGSQETTILKSVFVKNKIFSIRNGDWDFNPFNSEVEKQNENLFNTFQLIKQFIDSSNSNLQELYETLTKKIGLRKGLIPLLLGAVLKNEKNVYFKKNGFNESEKTVSGELLIEINKNPSDFEIKKVKIDSKMQNLLDELKINFSDFIKNDFDDSNSISQIVKGMSKWFISLPKYTVANLQTENKKLFSELGKSFINPNEYLIKLKDFENLNIKERKNEIDSFIKNQIQKIKEKLYELFDSKNDSELDSNLSAWFQSLSAETRNYIFTNFVSNVMSIFAGNHQDIDLFIRELSIKIMGTTIENWNQKYDGENSLEYFKNKITQFKKSYDNQQQIQEKRKNGIVEDGVSKISEKEFAIQYVKDGKEIVKTFEIQEKQSSASRFLKNEMKNNLSEYQNSLSKAEKCAILFNLIRETLEEV